jgi:hypothetical protein
VRDNLETLYGAIGDGAIAVRIPKHARKELEAYLDCGLLCRGFARLWCEGCGESRLVAFSCKGRGFCPSCLGRRMSATAANLIERVLPPQSGLWPVGADVPVAAAPGAAVPIRIVVNLREPRWSLGSRSGMRNTPALTTGHFYWARAPHHRYRQPLDSPARGG